MSTTALDSLPAASDGRPQHTRGLNDMEAESMTKAAPAPDTQVPGIIEIPDQNYIEEVSKLDLSGAASIDPTDHIAMRKWLKEVHMTFPQAPQIARTREPVSIDIKDVQITYGQENHFRVRIYDPRVEEAEESILRPALLMCHGGGWIHGMPEVDEDLSKYFASELRAVVIGVDYRLCPEYPFPQPNDDCYEALNWTCRNAAEYKIDVSRIGLWGCSSGGNLAASLALRDSNEHEVARLRHVNLVAPATCYPDLYPSALRSSNASLSRFPFAGSPEETFSGLKKLWHTYTGEKFSDQYASVLTASPRKNHPSVHITVAGCDGLRDEGVAYALLLRNAGVDTQLDIIPGVPHGINLSPTSLAAEQFYRNQVRTLNCSLYTNF